uniref:Lipocln_cytosolic_FA-bd_dom domain-containing protein n=1 Tax=Caenorhabditis tropicalis TaxID=1561998 RepID=A0A1I7UAC0_9PELO
MTDIVKCRWVLPCQSERHFVEFSHHPVNGKRTLVVDGRPVQCRNRNGDEVFTLDDMQLRICIKKTDARNFEYTLKIDDVIFETFRESQNRRYDRWETETEKIKYEVVFDKSDLKVRANGKILRSQHRFEEKEAITYFNIKKSQCHIIAVSSGMQRIGVIHSLYVNRMLEPLIIDEAPGTFTSRLPVN